MLLNLVAPLLLLCTAQKTDALLLVRRCSRRLRRLGLGTLLESRSVFASLCCCYFTIGFYVSSAFFDHVS